MFPCSPCVTPIPCPPSAAMLLMDGMNGGSGLGGSGVDAFAFGAAFNDLSGFSGGGGHSSNNTSAPAPSKFCYSRFPKYNFLIICTDFPDQSIKRH